MLWVLGACVVSFLLVQCGAENEGAVSTHLAPTDWSEVFVCTVDGSVHSLNALTGDVLWSYQTEPIGHNEQLSFMALGQNFTFYPDRRKGDIYTSRDGKPYVPFPTAKKLVEMSPFQWDEGRAIFLAKKSHKRYFVDPESGTDIMPSLQCEAEPSNQGGPFGLSRWLEIIRTDYDIVAEQILDVENPFPVAPLGSPAPRELQVLRFSVSDYKLFLRTPQPASEEEAPSVLPRLADIGGIEGSTIQAYYPSSNQPMWQTKFLFPLTHFAHVLMKAGNHEYLSSVKVEDAALEYLAIGDGNGKLVPIFEEGGGRLISIGDGSDRGDTTTTPFPDVKLLPAPPTAFSEIQIAMIVGAVLGGILVLAFILFYIKCVRVDRSSSSSLSSSSALTSTITSLSLPASPIPSASASPENPPALPSPPLPLTPNLTSLISSRYVREFVELGGLEGEEGKNLGKGGYGTVVRVRNITDDQIYAVKKVRKFGELSTTEIEQILREVKLLAKLEHPNIVRYFASWVEEEEVPRGVEKEEADGKSITRTITLTPPRAKRKQQQTSRASITILETVASPPMSPAYEAPPLSAPSYSAPAPEEIDDFLCFEFASDGPKEDEEDLNAGCSGTSLSSLSSQASNASQGSLLSELSQLSRNASAESLKSETGHSGAERQSENDSPSHSSSQKSQPLSQPSSLSPLLLDTSSTALAGNQKQWTLYIQMQLCSSGTLEHWMSRPGRKVEPDLNLLIFKQIVSALCYVHDPPHGLIHRDLKPANIFMVDDRSARVGDFGLSKRTNRIQAGCVSAAESLSHTAGVGSPLYCSPEQLAGREYTNKTDIFSLGVIFVEMHHVFSTKMERNMCLQDYRRYRLPKSPDHMFGPTSALGRFVRELLHPDPSQRPTSQQVLEHDIFKTSSSPSASPTFPSVS